MLDSDSPEELDSLSLTPDHEFTPGEVTLVSSDKVIFRIPAYYLQAHRQAVMLTRACLEAADKGAVLRDGLGGGGGSMTPPKHLYRHGD
ncbi:hypothetical protein Q5752_001689 [Cryptotrichosporon argae]